MKHMNAVQLRQSLGKAVRMLERNGEPILLDKGKKPVAALISLKDFQERFVEKAAAEARDELAHQIDALSREAKDKTPAEKILRELRNV